MVSSCRYITETDLREAASAVTDDEAVLLVAELYKCELLVLDELGRAPMSDELAPPGKPHRIKPLTQHQAMVLDRILMGRLDRGLPTLIGSNRLPDERGTFTWLGAAVESRLARHARSVVCSGVDLRRD